MSETTTVMDLAEIGMEIGRRLPQIIAMAKQSEIRKFTFFIANEQSPFTSEELRYLQTTLDFARYRPFVCQIRVENGTCQRRHGVDVIVTTMLGLV